MVLFSVLFSAPAVPFSAVPLPVMLPKVALLRPPTVPGTELRAGSPACAVSAACACTTALVAGTLRPPGARVVLAMGVALTLQPSAMWQSTQSSKLSSAHQ